MGRKRYAVDMVRDDPVRLRDRLDAIADEGGKVISIIWQPTREVTVEHGQTSHTALSGYIVVSEHESL
jgi:hypothetical protein